jgi:hypothetical protein
MTRFFHCVESSRHHLTVHKAHDNFELGVLIIIWTYWSVSGSGRESGLVKYAGTVSLFLQGGSNMTGTICV